MRRPEVELSDAAARYVEQHPGVIEKLAKGLPDVTAAEDFEVLRTEVRSRLRRRLAETRAYIASDEGRAAREAFLARVGLAR